MTINGARARAISLGVLAVVAMGACRGAPVAREVEMKVGRVMVDDAAHAPVVLLENEDQTLTLPIWIGVSEAQAIAMEMEGIQPPRPLTHDLVKHLFERLGVEFHRAVITELREGTYYARIHLAHRGSDLEIDSRPSDAIALAVRFRKPIFVAAPVLQHQRAVAARAPAARTLAVGGLTVQALSPDLAEHFGLDAGHGVVVSDVAQAAGDGVQRGDVILAIDDQPVDDVAEFRTRLAAHEGPAQLSIQRGTRVIQVAFDAHLGANGDDPDGN
jgi:bifunctional DNase/RNase